ncbi:hypothetical protein BDV95DRAFT_262713 [Massariosphaeria phaeospora]|uniref:Uncharacterized protein n=1 Tax=Massariosphaeria phaeospora TaxID=100035 RepID=A0A7C8MEJ3_9PLEO|nr:hypothetical protein BDV95DRAFT_262713 [Massariosphaeria phaeospora]
MHLVPAIAGISSLNASRRPVKMEPALAKQETGVARCPLGPNLESKHLRFLRLRAIRRWRPMGHSTFVRAGQQLFIQLEAGVRLGAIRDSARATSLAVVAIQVSQHRLEACGSKTVDGRRAQLLCCWDWRSIRRRAQPANPGQMGSSWRRWASLAVPLRFVLLGGERRPGILAQPQPQPQPPPPLSPPYVVPSPRAVYRLPPTGP